MLGVSVKQPLYTYVLFSPITGGPIYVGKGIHDRAYKHRFQPSPIGAHIRDLVSKGLKPRYERIPAKDADEAFEMEELLVAMIGRQEDGTGPLFNVRPGGRYFKQQPSTKAKLSAAHMGKTLSDAHKLAVSRTLTGRLQSEDRKQRHSIRMKQWWAERKAQRSQYVREEI
jgi:hypothetical protein